MVTPLIEFIVDLFLLLAGSLLAGEAASRLGQPALVGQLLVGLLLGPTLLGPFIGLGRLGPEFTSIQFIATVFVLFVAGLEIVPEDVYRMGPANLLLGIALFVVPLLASAGAITLLFPPEPFATTLFIALTLSITALPVMGIMLVQFGLVQRSSGRFLMNLALINEISAVTLFAILLQLHTGSGPPALAVGLAVGALGGFLALMFGLYFVIRHLERTRTWAVVQARFSAEWRSKGAGFALLMVLLVGAALLSQALDLTYVVGAFYAGVLVTHKTAGPEAHRSISTVFDTISWGFFIPLFFAFVGVQMNLQLLDSPGLLAALVALVGVAILSKVVVGYLAGQIRGEGSSDSLAIGFLCSSRGAVELAMAVILLQAGIFTLQIFTVVATVGLVATIAAPVGAVWAWRRSPDSRADLLRRVPALAKAHGWLGGLPAIVEWDDTPAPAGPPPAGSATASAPRPLRPPLPPPR
ncbi:MAG: cation:proton antiporter [Thermoplasmata archaeon]|jgi:Kef-type K+ transport system membrane component KefB